MSVSYAVIIGFVFEEIGGKIEKVETDTGVTKYNSDTGKPYQVTEKQIRTTLGNQVIFNTLEYPNSNCFESDLSFYTNDEESNMSGKNIIGSHYYIDNFESLELNDVLANISMCLYRDFGISSINTGLIKIFPYCSF